MDRIKQRQNRGYLIAGIGALVALLAFLLLPYVIITVSASSSGLSAYIAATLNATSLTQSSTSTSGTNFFPGSSSLSQGTLWLLPILALAALALVGVLILRDYPFGKGVNAPLANQKRWGNFGLIGIAALSVLIQVILFSNLNGQIQNAVNASNSGSTSTNVSTGTHIGFWLFLLGMLAVAGGAILLLVQENRQTPAALSPNIAGSTSYPPFQSPAPLDPYAQQYPPQPYPPQQPQSHSPEQWPPASNQPQSPYPPGQ